MGLDLQPTVTLYDLTNTYFEGAASDSRRTRARRRSAATARCAPGSMPAASCAAPGLRRQRPGTPDAGRDARSLEAPVGALVVMDRGVATDACVTWLRDNGLSGGQRERAVPTLQTPADRAHEVVSTDPAQCYSEERAEKERGIFSVSPPAGDEAQRRAVAPPRAQAPRPGLAAHRAIEDQAFPRRLALPSAVTANEAGDQAVASPGLAAPRTARWYPSGRTACAAARPTRTKTCGAPTPRPPSSARSNPLGLRRSTTALDGHLYITVIA